MNTSFIPTVSLKFSSLVGVGVLMMGSTSAVGLLFFCLNSGDAFGELLAGPKTKTKI